MRATNCDNCGACCMTQSTPPGYVAVIFNPDGWPEETGDHERVARLPEAARCELLDAIEDDAGDRPCCWLDQKTMRCRWYEHRPQICRDFEVGSESCQCWRDEFNVDVIETLTRIE